MADLRVVEEILMACARKELEDELFEVTAEEFLMMMLLFLFFLLHQCHHQQQQYP